MKLHPLLFAVSLLVLSIATNGQPYLGNGIKIGDTTDESTIVWVRLTELAEPKWDGLKWIGVTDRDFDVGELGEKQFPEGATLREMEGSLMGTPGSVRLTWWPVNRPRGKERSGWLEVDSNRDFTRNITIDGLKAEQLYELELVERSLILKNFDIIKLL